MSKLCIVFLLVLTVYASDIHFTKTPFSKIYYVTPPDASGDQLVVGESDLQGLCSFPYYLDTSIPYPREHNEMFDDKWIELAPGRYFSNVYVPTAAERNADFSRFGGQLIDPLTDKPFPGNIIPTARLWSVWAFRVKASEPGRNEYVLPQIAAGDTWYTAMYFSNTTEVSATITVRFYDLDGKAMKIGLSGIGEVSEHTVTIAPNAIAFLEAPDAGELKQGSAHVSLPQGVTGYGVFRQSVKEAGRIPQEAVVPLSAAGSKSADLIWDQAGFRNAVAIANPGDAEVTVGLNVMKADGTSLGASSVKVAARGRSVILLDEQPGLGGVTSQRGIVRISVSSGSVTALGLRFAGSAFTSVPVSYR